jgi:hypothetical protein
MVPSSSCAARRDATSGRSVAGIEVTSNAGRRQRGAATRGGGNVTRSPAPRTCSAAPRVPRFGSIPCRIISPTVSGRGCWPMTPRIQSAPRPKVTSGSRISVCPQCRPSVDGRRRRSSGAFRRPSSPRMRPRRPSPRPVPCLLMLGVMRRQVRERGRCPGGLQEQVLGSGGRRRGPGAPLASEAAGPRAANSGDHSADHSDNHRWAGDERAAPDSRHEPRPMARGPDRAAVANRPAGAEANDRNTVVRALAS